jgi:hypothetical protein
MGFHGRDLGGKVITVGAGTDSAVRGEVDSMKFLYRALAASSSNRRRFKEKGLFIG